MTDTLKLFRLLCNWFEMITGFGGRLSRTGLYRADRIGQLIPLVEDASDGGQITLELLGGSETIIVQCEDGQIYLASPARRVPGPPLFAEDVT